MKLCSLASGSSGNSILIASDHHAVLIDAGVSGKRIEEGLRSVDMTLADIDAVLVTHEHSDHIRGLGVMARRYGLPIYASPGTWQEIDEMTWIGKIPAELKRVISADDELTLGDLRLLPFSVSHDAAEPLAWRVENGLKKAAVATDMGCYDQTVADKLRDLDVLLLESNHDVRMLETGRYPYYLKLRILSEHGHLSNESAGRLLSEVLHSGLRHVYLGHLSRENNLAELAYETVRQTVEELAGEAPDLSVARRDTASEAIFW